MMAIVRRPRETRRLLKARVVSSLLLYMGPILRTGGYEILEVPAHVFFHCSKSVVERKSLEQTLENTKVSESLIWGIIACQVGGSL